MKEEPEIYSEEWIEQHADVVDWNYICKNVAVYSFSDEFFEKFGCELDWTQISKHNHKLSDSFIFKYYDKLFMGYLFVFRSFSDKFLRELNDAGKLDDFAWSKLNYNYHLQSLSKKFFFRI